MAKFKFTKWKSTTVLGTVCVMAGIVFGFVLPSVVSGLSNTTVVRANIAIASGTQITQDMVVQVKQGRSNLPAGTLRTVKSVVGEYAVADIPAHDNIASVQVSKEDPAALKPGQMKMSVPIKNFAAGVSGKLQAGDIVSVFCPQSITTSIQNGGSVIQPANHPKDLQYVKVASVTASTGQDTNPSDYNKTTSSKANPSGNTDKLPATVTLIVNDEQAATLAGMDNQTVHLAFVCSGKDKQADSLLNQADAASSSAASTASSTTSSGVSK